MEINNIVSEAKSIGITDIFRLLNETVGLSLKLFNKPICGSGYSNCIHDLSGVIDPNQTANIMTFVGNYDYKINPILNKIKDCTIVLIRVETPFFEFKGSNVCALVDSRLSGHGEDKHLTSVIFVANNEGLTDRQKMKLLKHELVHVAIKYATALLGLKLNHSTMEEFLCDYIPYATTDDMKIAADKMKSEISDYNQSAQDEYGKLLDSITVH